MATRSRIAFDNGDSVLSVYCHWDGYLEHNGRILLEHYTRDIEKVEALIDLGGFPKLGESPEEMESYPGEGAFEHHCIEDCINYFLDSDCQYLYIFNGLGWEYMTKEMDKPLLMVPSDVYGKAA